MKYTIWVGGYNREGSTNALFCTRFDTQKEDMELIGSYEGGKSPAFFTFDSGGKRLYAVQETGGDPSVGAAALFGLDLPLSGPPEIKPLAVASTCTPGPCHISLLAEEQALVTAEYRGGSVSLFRLKADGTPASPGPDQCVHHSGSSVHPSRQTKAHPHCVSPTPNGKFLLVCDLGTDTIEVYRVNGSKARPLEKAHTVPVAPGSGPRHVAFHPRGNVLFCINELSCTLDSFRFDPERGDMELLQTVPLVTAPVPPELTGAEVQVAPNGKFVYASIRGRNTIEILRYDSKKEHLEYLDRFDSGGKTPRHFSISPDGAYLAGANQDSGNLVIFALDPADGSAREVCRADGFASPACAVWQ